jgi:Fur family ferric uptake transcriptional regulator
LELLEELGMVTHTHLGHGAPTYHLAAEADHVHLVCRGCGEVSEVRPQLAEGLVKGLDDELGFEADVRHLTVFGRCGKCR